MGEDMKRAFWTVVGILIGLVIVCLFFVSCEEANQPVTVAAEKPCKEVTAKDNPVESQSAWPREGYKSDTVYYLLAKDGTVCQVPMVKWHKTKIGDCVTCEWEKKD